ncbi:hypothetical protein CDCA_CDCA11G3251 [Cyanidium caldarium]|uniref:Phospholipid/glycerol acyltransferase domain-containing protein n=1 Tax=Cyanidium caldarium TaxID=2771 RepID=A0AAV9IYL1_CYACA|nr:hypothetical protein CDCA_CDCA11G3251 [Cyanidium caldarium]
MTQVNVLQFVPAVPRFGRTCHTDRHDPSVGAPWRTREGVSTFWGLSAKAGRPRPLYRRWQCTLSESAPSTRARASRSRPRSTDITLYFAYGSNMNPRVLGPEAQFPHLARRVVDAEVFGAEPAVLEHHTLRLHVPGPRFLGEPAFANVVPCACSAEAKADGPVCDAVHGVVYTLTRRDLQRVLATEGVRLGMQQAETVTVRTYSGRRLEGVTVVRNRAAARANRADRYPSRRYAQLVMEGAQHYGIDARYVEQLRRRLAVDAAPSARTPATSAPTASPWARFLAASELPAALREFALQRHHTMGEVRFVAPPMPHEEERCAKPPLFFLPGLDGTGLSLLPHVRALQSRYDVRLLVVPRDNRDSMEQLARRTLQAMRQVLAERATTATTTHTTDADGDAASTVLAESMGCCLFLECARQYVLQTQHGATAADSTRDDKPLAHHVILVNAATAFALSPLAPVWQRLHWAPDPLYASMAYLAGPLMVDVPLLLQDPFRALQALSALGSLAQILPKATLQHRLSLLSDQRLTDVDYRRIAAHGARQFTLVAAANDTLIPSLRESELLLQRLSHGTPEVAAATAAAAPTVARYVAQSGGHALLQADSFDAYRALLVEADRVHQRIRDSRARYAATTTTPSVARPIAAAAPAASASFRPPDRATLSRALRQLSLQRRVLSPIFLDFDRVPLSPHTAPVLFVGNHTRFGLVDLPFLVEHVYRHRDVFVRGLAHPIIFQSEAWMQQARTTQENMDAVLSGRRASSFAENMRNLGAVPVTPRNLYRVLRQGDSALLFPGGAREAYKRRHESNRLFWPQHEEFVRMCARLGVTIVPFAAYGPDDSFEIVLDGEEMLRLPLLGDSVRRQFRRWGVAGDTVRRWRGDGAAGQQQQQRVGRDENLANLVAPLALPRPPLRLYFRFFEPVYPDATVVQDRQRADQVYNGIRETVARGLAQLESLARHRDPYLPFARRVAFENGIGAGAQAPTVTPWSCLEAHLWME